MIYSMNLILLLFQNLRSIGNDVISEQFTALSRNLYYFCFSKGNVGEVLPGATCTLSNFIVLNALDGAMNMGIQKVPGNKQEYDPYGRKCIKVTSHHIIFNFLRTVLQSMESKELKKALIAVDYAVFWSSSN